MMPARSEQPEPETAAVLIARRDSLTLRLTEVSVTLPADAVAALAAALARRAPKTSSPDPSPFLTVAEAAAYLQASRQRVYDLLCSRRLPKYKDGARVLIRRADLDAYLSR